MSNFFWVSTSLKHFVAFVRGTHSIVSGVKINFPSLKYSKLSGDVAKSQKQANLPAEREFITS